MIDDAVDQSARVSSAVHHLRRLGSVHLIVALLMLAAVLSEGSGMLLLCPVALLAVGGILIGAAKGLANRHLASAIIALIIVGLEAVGMATICFAMIVGIASAGPAWLQSTIIALLPLWWLIAIITAVAQAIRELNQTRQRLARGFEPIMPRTSEEPGQEKHT